MTVPTPEFPRAYTRARSAVRRPTIVQMRRWFSGLGAAGAARNARRAVERKKRDDFNALAWGDRSSLGRHDDNR